MDFLIQFDTDILNIVNSVDLTFGNVGLIIDLIIEIIEIFIDFFIWIVESVIYIFQAAIVCVIAFFYMCYFAILIVLVWIRDKLKEILPSI